jgi:hypothetical protein
MRYREGCEAIMIHFPWDKLLFWPDHLSMCRHCGAVDELLEGGRGFVDQWEGRSHSLMGHGG